MTLKSELKTINYDTVLKQNNVDHLIERMLDNIGSTDPELRDTLIFNTLGKLIIEDYLNEKQMGYILEVCLDKLFRGIDVVESDLVFTRSFSSLIIGLLLQKDRDKPFLKDEVALRTIQKSNEYLMLEQDTRGYVERKGWAHSIAHGADLLAEAVRHPAFNNERSLDFLATIKACLFKEGSSQAPFCDDEEERLIFVLEALIEKGLTDEDVVIWLSTISDALDQLKDKEGYCLNFFWKRSNIIDFLRGFYFRLLYKNAKPTLRTYISKTLAYWHKQVYS